MAILNKLKKLLAKKYNVKNLGKVKTIIDQQIIKDMAVYIIIINQSAFIRNLVIKKGLIEYNTNVILIKTGSIIEITKLYDYKKTKL